MRSRNWMEQNSLEGTSRLLMTLPDPHPTLAADPEADLDHPAGVPADLGRNQSPNPNQDQGPDQNHRPPLDLGLHQPPQPNPTLVQMLVRMTMQTDHNDQPNQSTHPVDCLTMHGKKVPPIISKSILINQSLVISNH